jgi:hypothetical protein
MIVKFKFKYDTIVKDSSEKDDEGNRLREWVISQEKYNSLRQIVPELPKDPLKENFYGWNEYVGHLESILEIVSEIEITSVIRVTSSPYTEFDDVLERVNSKLLNIDTRLEKYRDQVFNKKVNVHISGNSLLELDDVDLLQDSCTDELKDRLNEGWRIIAVCPQPDQRRPDYIIGRKEA